MSIVPRADFMAVKIALRPPHTSGVLHRCDGGEITAHGFVIGRHGYCVGVKPRDGIWRVARSNPVRSDADGVFIPVEDLAGANPGDAVIVSGPGSQESRIGRIAEITYGSGKPFFRLDLDPPPHEIADTGSS